MAPSCLEVLLVLFILVLPFLYETSKSFRYYFKFLMYYGIVMANAVMVIPIMMFRPGDVKNLLLASSVCHHVSTLLGLRWELRGREHLEKEQACIIVANHQSSLDILGMFDIWPIMDKCTVVAKKEIFYAWPFGLAAWLSGLIFIDRMNSEKARSVINTATNHIIEQKIKLWVFPEGTRHNTGEIHSFKKGAFHVAISSQLPILPVVFSSYYFLSAKDKRFDPGRVVITTLPPISTKGLGKADIEALMNKTRKAMAEVFHATSLEVQASCSSNKRHVK
ncbi:1-acyl-sn-glycerol-3-phosphate acyltransferase alpha isoform X1 [Neodiprion virginianus]|uniref:1-acyl-sn-glycerol-3-phosphate acyltransferase alpha isoform X1 n=1 Tax=Neodiprion fabricii TaxID=2872261 RepID=UPI001ED970E3|nr:1-acyl-sn-glycerol-3-phosphate acyltransferase alpha isoform X1 [Neodiprion fabricii]XP_046612653.1 1-acyl-sn-glycerol-3-phosphate acyltransferase alpha isoform X1 [Neodiprion virginianus]